MTTQIVQVVTVFGSKRCIGLQSIPNLFYSLSVTSISFMWNFVFETHQCISISSKSEVVYYLLHVK